MIRTLRYYLFRLEAAVFLVPVLILLFWPGLVSNFFSSTLMPHGHCYLWQPSLVWLHFFSDLFIGLAYLAISFGIGFLVYKARRDIPFHGMFIAFGLFIVACSFTHLMEVYTIWASTYWISGSIKMITAVASVATAIAIPVFIPKALDLIKEAKYSEQRKIEIESANKELEILYAKLKQLDESKTTFFTNVSHELRTPLTLIMGSASKLINRGDKANYSITDVQVIHKNAQTLFTYVNDLLDLAKLEVRKMELNYSETDIASLFRYSVSLFDSIINEQKINFIIETPESLKTFADPEKISRIFLNLLSNSVKFTPAGGKIKTKLSTLEDSIIWEIEDSGPGIKDDMKESIFERFSQTDQIADERFKSSGLGLTITKEFVELHNGNITVGDSSFGGAYFRIELPMKSSKNIVKTIPVWDMKMHKGAGEVAVNSIRDDKKSEVKRDRTRGKIRQSTAQGKENPLLLIIDDNPDLNDFLTESLLSQFNVVQEYNGKDGLATAKNLHPDLIITDLMMPEMSGEEMIQELRKNKELINIPVILLTAKTDEKQRVKLLAEGAQDYLIKPFSVEELTARINNLVKLKLAKETLQKDLQSRTADITSLIEEVTQRKKEIEISLHEKETMLKEIHHRVKNNLQIITSLLSLQVSKTSDKQSIRILNESKNRIKAMALIHEKLYHSEYLSQISLNAYLRELIESIFSSYDVDKRKIALNLESDDITSTIDVAIPLALIVNELVTNSIKYAFDENTKGKIEVTLRQVSSFEAELRISDNGKGIPESFDMENPSTLGLLLVKSLSSQADSEMTWSSGEGTTFIFRFPYKEVKE